MKDVKKGLMSDKFLVTSNTFMSELYFELDNADNDTREAIENCLAGMLAAIGIVSPTGDPVELVYIPDADEEGGKSV